MKCNYKTWFCRRNLLIGIPAACVLILILWVLPFFFMSAERGGYVYIREGASNEQVRDSLTARFGSSFASKSMQLISFLSPDWNKRIGAYYIEKGSSPFAAMRRVARGAQSPVKFTFNNIRTRDQLASLVADKLMMSKSEFFSALSDDSILQSVGCDSVNAISIFLPDTYEFYWNVKPQKMIKTMAEYYGKWWTNERRAKAAALSLSPQEVSVVASIVEEETNDPAERGMVARLYLNRVKTGMKLQADPTVKFAVNDFTLKRIGGEILKTASPYNTYMYIGLPPGPIRLPEKRTIDAVLNAPQHDYIYMCAKEDFSGHHNFTTSYPEHMANARRYQNALNARNIK